MVKRYNINPIKDFDLTEETTGSEGGASEWGGITGTLSSQIDLQNALDSKVDKNAPITGASKAKITYDSKGLVTSGADLDVSDIPTLTVSKISDFDSGVSNNFDVSANTLARHNRSHAISSSNDHTAGSNKIIYTDNNGVITELPIGEPLSVLTSSGLNMAPYWKTGLLIDEADPTSERVFVDDFISSMTEAGEVGELGWNYTNGYIIVTSSEDNHIGIITRRSGTTINQVASFYLSGGNNVSMFKLGHISEVTFVVKFVSISDVNMRFGIFSSVTSLTPLEGVFFEKLGTEANIFYKSVSGGNTASQNSGVTASASWYKMKMRRINNASYGFSINGYAEFILDTPTNAFPASTLPCNIGIQIIPTITGSAKNVYIDFISFKTGALIR